jgi:uncharacterized RDD family membrane protein YckC
MPIDPSEYEYAGFWIRVWAALIDTVLFIAVTTPILGALYGWDYGYHYDSGAPFRPTEFLITWVLPAIAVILFWRYRWATPGMRVMGARIVEAKSGEAPSTNCEGWMMPRRSSHQAPMRSASSRVTPQAIG